MTCENINRGWRLITDTINVVSEHGHELEELLSGECARCRLIGEDMLWEYARTV